MKAEEENNFRSALIDSPTETLLVLIKVSLTKNPWGRSSKQWVIFCCGSVAVFLTGNPPSLCSATWSSASSCCYESGKWKGCVRWEGAACAFQDENEYLQCWFSLRTGVSNFDARLWAEITLSCCIWLRIPSTSLFHKGNALCVRLRNLPSSQLAYGFVISSWEEIPYSFEHLE